MPSQTALEESSDDDVAEPQDEVAASRIKWPSRLADKVRLLRTLVKENPGRSAAWHAAHIANVSLDEVEEVLDALRESGVVFETATLIWY